MRGTRGGHGRSREPSQPSLDRPAGRRPALRVVTAGDGTRPRHIPPLIDAYLDADAEAAEGIEMEVHLRQCADCQDSYQRLAEVSGLLDLAPAGNPYRPAGSHAVDAGGAAMRWLTVATATAGALAFGIGWVARGFVRPSLRTDSDDGPRYRS
jgi:anti-sigma factor RsiW